MKNLSLTLKEISLIEEALELNVKYKDLSLIGFCNEEKAAIEREVSDIKTLLQKIKK